jgi:hypothetical protein
MVQVYDFIDIFDYLAGREGRHGAAKLPRPADFAGPFTRR